MEKHEERILKQSYTEKEVSMKKLLSAFLIVAMLWTPTVGYANSAQVYWEGYLNGEVLVLEEHSPIQVLREDLSFDFKDGEYDSIEGNATASYRMKNTSENRETVTMAFPFFSTHQDQQESSRIPRIEVQGVETDYTVYTGNIVPDRERKTSPLDSEEAVMLNLPEVLSHVERSEYTPTHFDPQAVGKLYRITTSQTKYSGDLLEVQMTYRMGEGGLLLEEGFNAFSRDDQRCILGTHADGGEAEIFLVGEPVEKKIAGVIRSEKEEKVVSDGFQVKEELLGEMTLGDYLKSRRDFSESVFTEAYEKDVYKNFDLLLGENPGDGYNAYWPLEDVLSPVEGSVRTFIMVYEVPFEAGEEKEVAISYAPSVTVDRSKTETPVYHVDYLLSPAQHWKSFQDLNIRITPSPKAPYVLESTPELQRGEDGVYTAKLETLPETELQFKLYAQEKITAADSVKSFFGNNLLWAYLLPILIPILVVLLIFIVKKRIR